MELILIILVLVLLFGGGGGYWAVGEAFGDLPNSITRKFFARARVTRSLLHQTTQDTGARPWSTRALASCHGAGGLRFEPCSLPRHNARFTAAGRSAKRALA
jgi:hypothetical protein